MRYIVLLVLLLWGCEAPQRPVLENPLSQPPETRITRGPVEGETLDKAEVSFHWEGNHRFVTEFRYRIDGKSWSQWTGGISVVLVMDEGEHMFEVMAV